MKPKAVNRMAWAHGAGRLTSTLYSDGSVKTSVSLLPLPSDTRPSIPLRSAGGVREALEAAIMKSAGDRHRYTGSRVGDLQILATDGFSALIGKPVDPLGAGPELGALSESQFRRDLPFELEVGPEYGEAILQVMTCTDRSRPIEHDFGPDSLILSAHEIDIHGQAHEAQVEIPVSWVRPPASFDDPPAFGLRPDQLRPMLGCWPLRISFEWAPYMTPEGRRVFPVRPVVFAPRDLFTGPSDWHGVIQPFPIDGRMDRARERSRIFGEVA